MTREAVLIDRDGRPTLRFERRLQARVDRVWRAVTAPDEMRAWFPAAVVGDRRVGAPLAFPFDDHVVDRSSNEIEPSLQPDTGNASARPDSFEGEVTAWDPTSVFAFTWNGDEIRIELTPDGDATRLVFTHELSNVSPAARTGAGWHACLANLDAHLGGPPASPDAWKDVYQDYLERMGPPPASLAPQMSLTWERGHHVSVERLWACLTDPKELEAWMGCGSVAIDLRLGGTVRFFDGPNPEVGVIVALEPERRIAYTWGDSLAVVDWQIAPAEHGCRLTLTKSGMPEERAAGWGAGWHSFLLQLDMYAASGELVVDEHEPRIPTYDALLRA